MIKLNMKSTVNGNIFIVLADKLLFSLFRTSA